MQMSVNSYYSLQFCFFSLKLLLAGGNPRRVMFFLKSAGILKEMFYPRLCCICHNWLVKGEEGVCLVCFSELPLTMWNLDSDNPAARTFWGRVPFQFASSFLHFHKGGMARKLLHQMKYRGDAQLALDLGRAFATQICEQSGIPTADFLVPVPLHPKKQRQRGYNQAEAFATGLSEILKIPVRPKALKRVRYSDTQTRKSREARWDNVNNLFMPGITQGLRTSTVIIVDDVITTGATIESCFLALQSAGIEKAGILSLAWADT